MDISLPPELEKCVRERIDRGDYANADELVQDAVHRLVEEDALDLESIRYRLQQADGEIERGEGLEFDEQTSQDLAKEIHERGLRRLAELRKTGTRG